MKRPIAMLLALLLTAGLFAFVSCGEEKNYTVKVNETNGYKKLHFSEKEIERFNKDLEEQGWAIVEFEGIEESDFSTYSEIPFGEKDSISDIFQYTDLVAKCRINNNTPPVYYAKFLYYLHSQNEMHTNYYHPFGRVYTFEIEEILFQSDTISYKKKDKVDIWIWDYTFARGTFETGAVLHRIKGREPPMTESFYVCLSVPKKTSWVDHDLHAEIISSVADMMLPRDYPFIVPLGNNVYEFGHEFFEEFFGDIHWGDYYVQVEDRITVGLPLRAEIENFEEKLMAIIEKYKN